MTSLLYLAKQDILSCKGQEHLTVILPDIYRHLKKYGYCIVQMWDLTETPLIALRDSLGQGQRHIRGDSNGIVTIAPNFLQNTSWDENHYYGTSSRKHPPHTDGAYLNGFLLKNGIYIRVGPPAVVLLQCVRATQQGGTNILIDAQRILHDLLTHHPDIAKVLMSYGCVSFCRDDHMAVDLPIYEQFSANRWRIRFRCDDTLYFSELMSTAVHHFYDHYINNDNYQHQINLEEGQILLVDNFRVLHGREAFSVTAEQSRFFRRTWVQDDRNIQTLQNFGNSSGNCHALDRHAVYSAVTPANLQSKRLSLDLGIRLPRHLQVSIGQAITPTFMSTAA